MEAYTELYKELAGRINEKMQAIAWIDLWHEQISYLTEELPFPVPAVFIAFNTENCNDMGQLIQECDFQIDFYLFYETFSDTYAGSYNQDSALSFLSLLTEINKLFHGKSGTNYQTMRKVGIFREESGGSGNLYRISFACTVEDASAIKEFQETQVNEIILIRENIQKQTQDNEPLYNIEQ